MIFLNIFPFAILYRIKISNVQPLEQEGLFDTIITELKRLKVDKITQAGENILFQNSFFNGQGRNHLMASIDSGAFIFHKSSRELVYKFSMLRMLVIAVGFAIFLGIVSQDRFIFYLMATWLAGFNWLLCILRQKIFFKCLAKIIEKNSLENKKVFGSAQTDTAPLLCDAERSWRENYFH